MELAVLVAFARCTFRAYATDVFKTWALGLKTKLKTFLRLGLVHTANGMTADRKRQF
ncbi:hypothetical protein [Lactiplantibacillus daowaiensis]|uniref:Uncharacterized protein n=1 Tax=Lactiplantibacillus daowaiensis TaxID=2559918 RepID=A0ABW1S2R4_9LACO|nr:hypothetical protein [Lactiplantibacillus daowaiensis]